MSIQTIANAVLILLVIGWIGVRQMTWRPVALGKLWRSPLIFAVAAWILADLGVSSVRMLTNNPSKCEGLAANGTLILNRVPLTAEPNPHNVRYLRTKQSRLGHLIDGL